MVLTIGPHQTDACRNGTSCGGGDTFLDWPKFNELTINVKLKATQRPILWEFVAQLHIADNFTLGHKC
jgi:hypothetical protein